LPRDRATGAAVARRRARPKAFRLGRFVQPLLVEQDVPDFDASPALADLQAKKRAYRRVSELHVDLDDRRCVPLRREAGGQGIAQSSALEKELGRRIDEVGDVGRVIVQDHRHEFRCVGQPQFARDVHQRVGDDLLARERAPLPQTSTGGIHCLRGAH
jgi:hypothetical protein